jgi:predicted GNAT superfamily acetyltransferase
VSPASGGYEIRPFQSVEECRECVALQEATWGDGFSERVPTAILRVSQRLGGIASGAYDSSGELIGFVFGMTGLDAEGLVHWSDMLAVTPGKRDGGLGRKLKAHQRTVLLKRGVVRMIWTFDPLQSRNAHLNLNHLGAVSREYERDMYGQTDSPLHDGIGTDRLLALWLMDSERVEHRLSSGFEPDVSLLARSGVALGHHPPKTSGHPRPSNPATELTDPMISVTIPADLDTLKRDDLSLATDWRAATRLVLEAYLDRHYEVRELVRGSSVSHYILIKRNDDAR